MQDVVTIQQLNGRFSSHTTRWEQHHAEQQCCNDELAQEAMEHNAVIDKPASAVASDVYGFSSKSVDTFEERTVLLASNVLAGPLAKRPCKMNLFEALWKHSLLVHR